MLWPAPLIHAHVHKQASGKAGVHGQPCQTLSHFAVCVCVCVNHCVCQGINDCVCGVSMCTPVCARVLPRPQQGAAERMCVSRQDRFSHYY